MNGLGGSDASAGNADLVREYRAATQFQNNHRRGRGDSCGVVQDRITSTLGLSQPSPIWEK